MSDTKQFINSKSLTHCVQPSRRGLLRFCGVSGAIAVAGCTDSMPSDAIGGGSDDSEPTDSGFDAESDGDPVASDTPLRATLTG